MTRHKDRKAHFTPKYPLALYLYGVAGSGKSSLVRHFASAIQHAVNRYADPELSVQHVKQNLNKPMDTLQLELDLRPNNNDLSVMSIVQGRRMALSQTKPGLVVLGLEEMAPYHNDRKHSGDDQDSNHDGFDPDQLSTAQLIRHRFGGRTGKYNGDADVDKSNGNSYTARQYRSPDVPTSKKDVSNTNNKRGMSGDACIITVFTSNYALEDPCRKALTELEMFQNLTCIQFEAISGQDRIEFAKSYTSHLVRERFQQNSSMRVRIKFGISLGEGDVRPLVKRLRMLAHYLCVLVHDAPILPNKKRRHPEEQQQDIDASIQPSQEHCCCITLLGTDQTTLELRMCSMGNLLPVIPRIVDQRTELALQTLRREMGDTPELSVVIDFWFSKVLAPAVVVSNDLEKIQRLVTALASSDRVRSIRGVDPKQYKMMRSLYDPVDTPNLRDDILTQLGDDTAGSVVVELLCANTDAQLRIREIIEDQPSMTAFSTAKSALGKSGLFFGVYVNGDITPEIRSRASLIL